MQNFKVVLVKEKAASWVHVALFCHLKLLDTIFGLA
jgi:hypothetical protein